MPVFIFFLYLFALIMNYLLHYFLNMKSGNFRIMDKNRLFCRTFKNDRKPLYQKKKYLFIYDNVRNHHALHFFY